MVTYAKEALELFSCARNATLLHCMKKALVPYAELNNYMRMQCSMVLLGKYVHKVMNEKCCRNKKFVCDNVGVYGAYQFFAPEQHFFSFFVAAILCQCCRDIFFAPQSSFLLHCRKYLTWGTRAFSYARAMEQCCIACA